jgi:hypothetical protein
METFIKIVLPILLFALVATLFAGLYALFKGGDFGRSYSNKLMRLRVLLQFVIVCILAAGMFWSMSHR